MDEPFLRIARSFLEHPIFKALDHRDKCIMYFILENLCYKEQDFDDHGVVIHLMPGQLCMAKREIARLTNTSLNETHRLLLKMSRAGFLIQEVIQQKTVLTYVWSDIYKTSETRNETRVKQERNRIETETKNERRKEEENVKKTIVRHGGNVDNSQASYQHSPHASDSPFSQKKEKQQNDSPLSFNPNRIDRYIEFVQAFRYFTGEPMTDKDRDGWLNMLGGNTDDFLLALAFYKKKESAAFKKNKNRPPFRKPAAYLNTVVYDRLWEKEEQEEKAKKADRDHIERLITNGAI